jgi:hypothetical protein
VEVDENDTSTGLVKSKVEGLRALVVDAEKEVSNV